MIFVLSGEGRTDTLGIIALELEKTFEDIVVAIFFRDSDGVRTSKRTLWQQKLDAINGGFTSVQFDQGVAMLPKPTSEAWLLSAAQKQPYQNCDKLEDLPGNQVSPNHPKKKLEAAFGYKKTAQEICEWLEGIGFDSDKALAMPSFRAFRNRLNEVIDGIRH